MTRARYPREQLEAVREREVAIGRVERGPGQNVAPRRTTPTYESTYRPGAYGVDAASRAYSTGQTPAFDAPSQSAADLTYQSGELPDRATPPTERAADARPERTTPPTGRAPETSPPQAPAGGQPVEDTTSRAPLGGDVPSSVPAADAPARAPMSPQIP